ncbi:MAG TPA: amidohydrolase family protein [Chloroflexia bacterium]|nr:amidohydrolase family protein [Chloroflexia bacterium]
MLTLLNARLIDGTGAPPQTGVTVRIDGSRIAAVAGPGATPPAPDGPTIDLAGRTLLPGLINAHIHILMEANSGDSFASMHQESLPNLTIQAAARGRQLLAAGITTARDLGGYQYVELALRDAFARGTLPGPRLLCAGKLITMTGGHGWPIGREADGPVDMRKAVREQLKAGADVIKLMATGGVLTRGVEPGSAQLEEDELRAGIEEAHKAGRRTAAHAQGTTGIKNAIRAGIDTIEHGIFLDDEAVALMRERGVIFVPTLAAPYQIVAAGEARGIPAYAVEKSRRITEAHFRSFALAHAAGVVIAAGNDGGTPFNPAADLVTELRLMTEHGMTALEALRTAGEGSARALGVAGEIGTVAPGKAADLLVVDGDPLAEIGALGRPWLVIQGGQVVVSAPDRPPSAH